MRACGAVVIDDQILMVRHRHDGRDYWTLPGGGIEAGETPWQAAEREVVEETGLTLQAKRFLFWQPGGRTGTYCFLMSKPEPGHAVQLGHDPEETHMAQEERMLQAVAWHPLSSLHDDVQVKHVNQFLDRAAVEPETELVSAGAGNSNIRNLGSGPGEQTLDGCSVEFYLSLPPGPEPVLVRDAIEPGASILELGCGVGRITHPLLEMGFAVTPVDNSLEMLSHIAAPVAVHGDIESLALDQSFDAVLLASQLVNAPARETREALLACCDRHLAESGQLIVQCHKPGIEVAAPGPLGERDGVASFLDSVEQRGDILAVSMRWKKGDREWTQSYETCVLSEEALVGELGEQGFVVDRWLDEAHTWFVAVRK